MRSSRHNTGGLFSLLRPALAFLSLFAIVVMGSVRVAAWPPTVQPASDAPQAPPMEGIRLATTTVTPSISPTLTPTPSPAPGCTPAWEEVDSPNPDSEDNFLFGIAAISANDMWAVGRYQSNPSRTLTLHWDGNQWKQAPSPNTGTANLLSGVAGVSRNDVWAVGYYSSPGVEATLVEHWDGASWSIVPSPNVGPGSILSKVAAVSANDVWAVGRYTEVIGGGGGYFRTLVEHWDGNQWSVIPSPNPNPSTGNNELLDVSAISANDVWAVGYYFIQGVGTRTLVEHWDGTQWSVIPSPNIGSGDNGLDGVSALSSMDVWAIGYYQRYGMTLHWDGTSWNQVSIPNPDGAYLEAVRAFSTNDAWVVGYYLSKTIDESLVLHWDGMNWTRIPSPNPGIIVNILYGVSAVSIKDVWAAGTHWNGFGTPWLTLVEHYTNPCLTPSPTATNTPTNTPTPSPAPGCTPAWEEVDSPNPDSEDNFLFGITAISANDLWAVGRYQSNPSRTLTLHWDGTQWKQAPSPNTGTADLLSGVAGVSRNDVWAVGYYSSPGIEATLVEHWDGASWSIVPSPNVGPGSILSKVAAVSANDVWAVGRYTEVIGGGGGYFRTLVEHWDGNQWSVIPSPNPNPSTGNNELFDVSAISANDAWAVGYYFIQGVGTRTLVEHWDGANWNIIPSPNIVSYDNALNGVSALSPNDVWAVGYYHRQNLTLHWDGTNWSHVPSPEIDVSDFYSVVALSPSDVWAVGTYFGQTRSETLVLRWNGTNWTKSPSPNPGTVENILSGVSAVPANDIWAAGDHWNGFGTPFLTLVEHYTNPCLTPSPTVTTTPTNTPTPCAITFTDVYPSDYFYQAVFYLYCRGVISGYSDNTFRPYNNTTRAQLCKIVALAEEWSIECPQTPTFIDVPREDPFYCYVETAYSHNVISGYSDGTFRPDNNVTRAQLCKIVVLARGWRIECPQTPTFTDVPSESPFYCYVETAYSHNVISGYSDGTFRPDNFATRGQIARIVYNAIVEPDSR